VDKIKVLITGSNGFIGRNLISYLEPNFEVLGLQRSPANKSCCMQVDYNDISQLTRVFETFQPMVVVHLASVTSRTRSMDDFSSFIDANVALTNRLLFIGTSLVKPPKFIFLSSSEVYGPQLGKLTEKASLQPVSPYGLTKAIAESLFDFYYRNYGISAHIIRLFNAFGPGQEKGFFFSDLLASFNENKVFEMTKGEQKRDFIFIDDVTKAIEMFIYRDNILECVNLSSGNPLSLNQIIQMFNLKVNGKLKVNKCIPYRQNEIWEMYGDNELLLSFGYKLDFSISMGLDLMINNEKV